MNTKRSSVALPAASKPALAPPSSEVVEESYEAKLISRVLAVSGEGDKNEWLIEDGGQGAAGTHAHTHAHTHAYTCTHMHTHTCGKSLGVSSAMSVLRQESVRGKR